MTATLGTSTSDPARPGDPAHPDSVVRDGRAGVPLCAGLYAHVVELLAAALDASAWSVRSRRGLRRETHRPMTSDDAIRNDERLHSESTETTPLRPRVHGSAHGEGIPLGGRSRRDVGSQRSRASSAHRGISSGTAVTRLVRGHPCSYSAPHALSAPPRSSLRSWFSDLGPVRVARTRRRRAPTRPAARLCRLRPRRRSRAVGPYRHADPSQRRQRPVPR